MNEKTREPLATEEVRQQAEAVASTLRRKGVVRRLERAVEDRNPHIDVKYAIWTAGAELRELPDD